MEKPKKNNEVDAWNRALRKLSRKERTSLEIRTDLKDQGYAEEVVEKILVKLILHRFIDDARYAESYSRLQGSGGKGPAVIRTKLRQKGLNLTIEEISRIVFEAQGRDELTRAIELIERRYPNFRNNRATAKKAYETLIRRGFSFQTARNAVQSKEPILDDES